MELTLEEALRRGVEAHQAGQVQEADKLYTAILNADPRHAGANHNTGILCVGVGKLEQALYFFKTAVEVNPSVEQHWISYINTLINLNQIDEAKNTLDQATINGVKGDAFDQFEELIEQRQVAGSISTHQDPPQHLLQTVIGFYTQGELKNAARQSEELICQFPESALLFNLYGVVLGRLQKLEESIKKYELALEIEPNFAEAHNNLGLAFRKKSEFNRAIECYTQAVTINPEFAEAHNNLGVVFKESGKISKAIESFRLAVSINAGFSDAYFNLGVVLKDERILLESMQCFKNAIQINPQDADAQQSYSTILMYLSDWRDVVKHSDIALTLSSANDIWGFRLYTWIYHPDLTAKQISDEHIRWGEQFPEVPKAYFVNHDRQINRRLRIGYVSPDFRNHSCRFFFEPLFSSHNHAKFEVFAYSNVKCEDEHTQRFKAYFDEWKDISYLSDQEVFKMIQKDKIDILIDSCGHMKHTRLGVFALKPAPVQVTWLGAAWTTGLRQMDYAMFDCYMGQPDVQACEKIIRLPKTWAAYRPCNKAINTLITVLPALKNGYITFGYSGRTERLNYKVFRTWAQLLDRLTDSRLIIDFKCFSDPDTKLYFNDLMANFGLDMGRVELRYSKNIFEALGEIDILLDSFPHNGGTMLYDALWMGVPAITLASRPPVGRIGQSLMTNLGLADWVAIDEASYIAIAVTFSQDFEALAELRLNMRDRMSSSPIMDEKSFTNDVENAYKGIWQHWCTGDLNY